MSSKFSGPRIRFKTPAVCKKSPPGPDVTAWPAPTLNLWYQFTGTDRTGTYLNVNQQFQAPLFAPAVPTYRVQFTYGTTDWDIVFEQFAFGPEWEIRATATRGILAVVVQPNKLYTPRQLQPYDSNYVTLNDPLTVATSAARALL